ncbi:MAG: hypothetical protein QOE97_229 [Pseudonocardiales bacterium]|nr:hypothetical protein [Pseudonocardiales bacterium]
MPIICLPDEAARAAVGPLPPGTSVVLWDGTGEPPPEFEQVEFVVPRYPGAPLPAEVLAAAPRLKVIQLLSAGVEPWLDRIPPGVTLCNGRGIHGASTAELAVAGLLSVMRDLPGFRTAQDEHRWAQHPTGGMAGANVLVVGAGDIGRRIATALGAFDATVTLVARHARDGVRSMDELPGLLPHQDSVVLAVPLTPETRALVDAGFLARMRDGAVLVNIARGALVDTGALVAELRAGRLRAFLDVTDPEPLPPDHPLWDAPGVLITPHVGGGTHGWEQRAYRLAREQILRFVAGEPLENVVTDGY